ncbi:MAG: crotonobetainyl-CoA:carnitine CoA-transferase CaiB-like acyl-CoA transferase [Oceanospirillaceae bacterium]|jgi:crotonobetainyl-CoA:carnitine CoA-transferase CaiB-like acyl-CoA transferase
MIEKPALEKTTAKPLEGLTVLELGHFIAAPHCTRLMADLGATVIKVESPNSGDPVRSWGMAIDGNTLWWSVHGRGKQCITLNLKTEQGIAIAKQLIEQADIVVENFRPGQLAKWGLGYAQMQLLNPGIILVHISGYGQSGPYKDRVSFGSIGEAFGGIRHLTGYPKEVSDLPPVRTGVSLGDSLAGMFGVIGALSAVYERDVAGTGVGREVDVALYESVFSLMEGALPEYGEFNAIRNPTGSAIPTAAPSNTYKCKDGMWLAIGANGDKIFKRLCQIIGKPELGESDLYDSNPKRVANAPLLDNLIENWTLQQDSQAAESLLLENDIPAGRLLNIQDCATDPHYLARDMVMKVADPRFGEVTHPGIVPKFSGQGPDISWPGPEIGAHNNHIYQDLLGIDAAQIAQYKAAGVI